MTPYEAANNPRGKKMQEYQVMALNFRKDCLLRLPASEIFLLHSF